MNKAFLMKIIRVGDSRAVVIPEAFLKHLDADRGDLVYWSAGEKGVAQIVKVEQTLPMGIIKA